jgi:hypothetical protein
MENNTPPSDRYEVRPDNHGLFAVFDRYADSVVYKNNSLKRGEADTNCDRLNRQYHEWMTQNKRSPTLGAIVDKCVESWAAMTPAARQSLLEEMATVTRFSPDMPSPEGLAMISEYFGLPSEMRGRLIMAITKDGFTIEEYKRFNED